MHIALKILMHVFDDSKDISVIGTGADELCSGQNSVKELFLNNFAEATAKRFEWLWSKFTIYNENAVVAMSLIIHLEYQGNNLQIPIRWSVVLRKTERWYGFIDMHLHLLSTKMKGKHTLKKRRLVYRVQLFAC